MALLWGGQEQEVQGSMKSLVGVALWREKEGSRI